MQVEQLIRYIIEEPLEEDEKNRAFKLVFWTNFIVFIFC